MTNKVIFKIKISATYKIQWCFVGKDSKETIIQLNNKNQEEYLLSTSLIDNKSSIKFGDDLFTNPQDFKLHEIELFGKEYTVIAEVLFALIINDLKNK